MKLRYVSPPRGMFKGSNVMTPHIIAYYKLRDGYAELSEGRGIRNQPIFGVTVCGNADRENRSQLFQSKLLAEDYIESLS